MSHFSSVPLSFTTQHQAGTEIGLVNANFVLKKALQQFNTEERSAIILRCDELPFVAGNKNDLLKVFGKLLLMILEKRALVPKLFLHIHCASRAEEATSFSNTALQPSFIQFNSNIIPCA